MEFVKASRSIRFCEEQTLSPKDRLPLTRQVCGAVQHAHSLVVLPSDARSAYRNKLTPSFRHSSLGLRPSRTSRLRD